jgi:hypothetical protein
MLSLDRELNRRIEVAEKQRRPSEANLLLLHDPIEDEEPTASLVREARNKADAELDMKIRMGRCHGIWKRMKEILKTEHDIVWYSPAEMNPKVTFD